MPEKRHAPRAPEHRSQRAGLLGMVAPLAALLLTGCGEKPWPPGVQEVPPQSPVLEPEAALETFFLPPGYRIELVASEPLVQDPVAIDFDGDGRMWVVEMRSYMPNLEGEGEDARSGRIVVLEDRDDDGQMDHRTVFMDGLALPRAVKVLERGVLVAAPPYLWLARDTDGDLRADTREVVADDYGDPESNPEHNANGLHWGLDNWLHNAKYDAQFRLSGDGFRRRAQPALGQWGVTGDEFGRLYRNYNEDPLHVDLVAPHYLARNPNLTRRRGVYEEVTENGPVWPVRPTPGVNRGYRERTLREDSTLAHFTSAGSPTVYLGDRLPEELRGDVFVTEPAGNLVRRYDVRESADGTLSADNAYENAEFLASTDERFRPVNLATAPDGTLYVVDMYRGIIQHRRFITDYLERQIRARNLEQPVGLGRIYRIVHRSTERAERPRLSSSTPAELVAFLEHPNGWWRQTAQRLLVERGDRGVAPALRRLALQGGDERARLHALWTLEGLAAVDRELVLRALADPSPHVRAAAVRVSEPLLAGCDTLRAALLARVDDPAPQVRWQLAASLGELPPAQRVDALARVLERFGEDSIAVDVALSGLHGHEMPVLERLLAGGSSAGRSQAIERLAATVVEAGGEAEPEQVDRLLGWVAEESRPRWQRLALLEGVEALLPPVRGDAEPRPLRMERRPAGVLAAATSPDLEVRAAAERIASRLDWPGKPRPAGSTGPRPLTPEEQQRFAAGERVYQATCAGCHQANGMGLSGVAKPLSGSPWVTGETGPLIRILLHGKEGEMLMPPVGHSLDDEQIAAVLTFIRRSWGNESSPVRAEQVTEVRGYTTGRDRPWSDAELEEVRR